MQSDIFATNMTTMSPEKIKEMVDKMEHIPCPYYDGFPWPSFPSFRMKGIENAIKDIINFETRETDILLCAFAKSGTHWTFEILKMLLTTTTELAKEVKQNTMLEGVVDLKFLDAFPSPRILDSHFLFQYLPKKHMDGKRKTVHVLRNPKDVLVSYFYHAQKEKILDLFVPWNEFFEVWIEEKLPVRSWYDYVLGFEQAERDYPGMIHTCYFEDLKENLEREIIKIAKFIGVNPSDEVVKSIAKATSFDNMQKNKFDITSVTHGKGFVYRKGEVGDWKNHFTVAQNERFDAQFKDKMRSCNYKFVFE